MNLLKSNTKYKLSYEPITSSTPAFNIDYKEDGTQSFLTAGMRFFDTKSELFSIIAVEYEMASSFNTTVDASKMDKAKIDLDRTSSADHRPFAVTLGFGLMF